jgi:hypothetical protein
MVAPLKPAHEAALAKAEPLIKTAKIAKNIFTVFLILKPLFAGGILGP